MTNIDYTFFNIQYILRADYDNMRDIVSDTIIAAELAYEEAKQAEIDAWEVYSSKYESEYENTFSKQCAEKSSELEYAEYSKIYDRLETVEKSRDTCISVGNSVMSDYVEISNAVKYAHTLSIGIENIYASAEKKLSHMICIIEDSAEYTDEPPRKKAKFIRAPTERF